MTPKEDYRMPEQLSNYSVIGFRFSEPASPPLFELFALGQERITTTDYNWDGLKRTDGPLLLFQYTLAGSGCIRIGEQTHQLGPGAAFLVEIPGDHRYFFPASEQSWEFLFILFRPSGILDYWADIKRQLGSVTNIPKDQPIIQLLQYMYRNAKNGVISDAYHASSIVYQFAMELLRYSCQGKAADHWPANIKKAAEWIELNYDRIIGVDEICKHAGLSKYHFVRRFTQITGESPNTYLTKIRIGHAIRLLRETEVNVDDIARSVGFAGGSYFTKVFRKWTGSSPSEYRHGRDRLSFHQFFFG
jgi:AraC-like DNA-binding protein